MRVTPLPAKIPAISLVPVLVIFNASFVAKVIASVLIWAPVRVTSFNALEPPTASLKVISPASAEITKPVLVEILDVLVPSVPPV